MYNSAKALNCAIEEWSRGITEPTRGAQNGAERIDAYIRGAQGLGWPSAALTPKDSTAYTRNGQFQWCGAFAAWCLGAGGLERGVRKSRLPSTYRLRRLRAAPRPRTTAPRARRAAPWRCAGGGLRRGAGVGRAYHPGARAGPRRAAGLHRGGQCARRAAGRRCGGGGCHAH